MKSDWSLTLRPIFSGCPALFLGLFRLFSVFPYIRMTLTET